MWLDYSILGEVRISMEEYLRGVLKKFPEEITETPETPSAAIFFKFKDNNERELLDEKRAHAFHHTVSQLLFTGIRCRNESHTAIHFLTTRVRKPDEDDWKKLRRLLGYLKRTNKLPLILRSNGLNTIKWWVDTLYADNDNMRGHIGGTMSMGKNGRGSIISILMKKKLNTKISTETELIGADNVMPQILWKKYFLEAQGYGIDKNILYLDNTNAVLLEKNGKKSSTKKRNISTCATI